MTHATLDQLLDAATDDTVTVTFPVTLETTLTEELPPPVIDNLRKLKKLGILNGAALFALVGQAPLDPINLVGTLMRLLPDGWAFSAVDFSMVRVLSKDTRGTASAMRVDLMGDVIQFLARNKAGQLTLYKEFQVVPSPTTWDQVQVLMNETVEAAKRESTGA